MEKEARATYNKATGWMRLTFSSIPSLDTRTHMKQIGFRYKPRGKAWSAKWTVERETFAKGLAGGIGIVDIKPNWMQKASYASQMAQKHKQESQQRYDQFKRELETIPFGQPILVGHHSEKSHRAHLKRLDNQMKKSMEEHQIANLYKERAKRFEFKARGESPDLIYRRIQRLEADERKFGKELELIEMAKKAPKLIETMGVRLESETHWRKWLEHTQQRLIVEREAYKKTKGIPMEQLQLKKGDTVSTYLGQAKVVRVNPKTVTVSMVGRQPEWLLKLDYSKIRGKA